jgi:hypothetical protein
MNYFDLIDNFDSYHQNRDHLEEYIQQHIQIQTPKDIKQLKSGLMELKSEMSEIKSQLKEMNLMMAEMMNILKK